MALFLGTYNVPTNKKLRVNTTDVTAVYSNGVLVWKYVKGSTTTPGTGTGTGTVVVPGSKGTWSQLLGSGNQLRVTTHYDNKCNLLGSNAIVYINGQNMGGSMPAGYAQGGMLSGPQGCKPGGAIDKHIVTRYAILKWIPA